MIRVILASASPRRRELLSQIGIPFTVVTSTCEEKINNSLPERVVCELSEQKAEDVWKKLTEVSHDERIAGIEDGEFLVIGADTIVYYEGKILGKPEHEEQAYEMLKALSGHSHEVYTGVTFCYGKKGKMKIHTFYEKTDVVLFSMSKQEIIDYIATKEPMDKAGAYGIQGRFAAYIKEIHGDYNNVVGLPVGRLYQEWKECFANEKGSYF